MKTFATIREYMQDRMNHGEPDIPPGSPVEVPPEHNPVDIPPGGPVEAPPQQPEISPEPPVELPPAPTEKALCELCEEVWCRLRGICVRSELFWSKHH